MQELSRQNGTHRRAWNRMRGDLGKDASVAVTCATEPSLGRDGVR